MPNSSTSLSDLSLVDRWLAVIKQLKALILKSLNEEEPIAALRLWQALAERLHLLIENITDSSNAESLPLQVLEQVLRWDFLENIAAKLDRRALVQLQKWCTQALNLPALGEHTSALNKTLGKLLQLHSKAKATSQASSGSFDLGKLLEEYQTSTGALGAFIRSYATAQPAELSAAYKEVKDCEHAMRSRLATAAWDIYEGSATVAAAAVKTISADTQLVALEWLATLIEQQSILGQQTNCLIFSYRQRLAELRNELKMAVACLASDLSFTEENITLWLNAQRAFSQGIRAFLASILADGEAILGPAPYAYAFIGFGSLSRDEMLPYSDLECALLLAPDLTAEQEKLAQAYLFSLWQWLSFSLQGLGESGERGDLLGLHLDHQLCPTLTSQGLAGFYGSAEKLIFETLLTPQDLASAQAYSLMQPVYIAGHSGGSDWTAERLMANYQRNFKKRLKQLTKTSTTSAEATPQQAMALAQLAEHKWLWQDLLDNEADGKLAISVNVKEHYATPLFCLIYDLALYHDLAISTQPASVGDTEAAFAQQVPNTCDMLTTLANADYVSETFGRALAQAYCLAMYLRWQIQHHYQQHLGEELAVVPTASATALTTLLEQDPLLIQQIARTLPGPTLQQLYRLSPFFYEKLHHCYRFIFAPVVSMLNAQAAAFENKPPSSLPRTLSNPVAAVPSLNQFNSLLIPSVWYDPLFNHFAELLESNILQTNQPLSTNKTLVNWIHSLGNYLLQLGADQQTHEKIYNELTLRGGAEELRATYLNVLLNSPSEQELALKLSFIPTRSGYRQSERLEYAALKEALLAISLPEVEELSTASNKAVLVCASLQSPSLGKRRLHPEVVKVLIDEKGDIKPFFPDTKSRHRVGCVTYCGYALHIKQQPDHPGMERAVDLLYRRLIGNGATPNELAVLTVNGAFGTRRYPVLVSLTVPGLTLKDTLAKPRAQWPVWDLEQLKGLCLASLLLNPGDMASRNLVSYQLRSGLHSLVSVDNDVVFVEPVLKESWFSAQNLQVINILLCFREIAYGSLAREVLEAWCALDVAAVLQAWLTDIETYEKAYESLMSEQEIQQWYEKDAENAFTPSTLFRQGVVAQLALNLSYLQGIFRVALQTHEAITLWQVTEKLQPQIVKFYRPVLENKSLTPEQRLQYAAQTAHMSRTSSQALTAMLGRVPTQAEIKAKNCFSPAAAKDELQILQIEQLEDTVLMHHAGEPGQGRAVKADFTPLLHANSQISLDRQRKIIQALMNFSYQQLTLINCTVLTDDDLKILISKNPAALYSLRLRQCPQISVKTLDYLAQYCTQLKLLECTDTAIDKVASVYFNQPLLFPALTTLNLSRSSNLKNVQLAAPHLATVQINDCRSLENIQFNAPQLTHLTASNCPVLTQVSTESSSLKNVDFSNCKSLTEQTVLQLGAGLTQLTLKGCNQLSATDFREHYPFLAALNWRHYAANPNFIQWIKSSLKQALNAQSLTVAQLPPFVTSKLYLRLSILLNWQFNFLHQMLTRLKDQKLNKWEIKTLSESWQVAPDPLILVSHLVSLLQNHSGRVYSAAGKALRGCWAVIPNPDTLLSTLLPLLQVEKTDRREAIVDALGDCWFYLSNPLNFFNPFLVFLQHEEARSVCTAATKALKTLANNWAKIPDPVALFNALRPLLTHKEQVVREAVIISLINSWTYLPNPLLLNVLIPLLGDAEANVREAVRQTLLSGWAEVSNSEMWINRLVPLLMNEEKVLREAASQALADSWNYLPDSALLANALMPLLKDDKAYVCAAAASVFVNCWAYLPEAATLDRALLISLLANKEPEVRQAAAKALADSWGYMSAPETLVEALIPLLHENEAYVRAEAACAFINSWPYLSEPSNLINALLPLLQDDDSCVRQAAAKALAGCWAQVSAPIAPITTRLIQLLLDEEHGVQIAVVQALTGCWALVTSPITVFKALIPLLQKQSGLLNQKARLTHAAATQAVASCWTQISDPAALIDDLLSLLADKQQTTCQAVWLALGNSWAYLSNPSVMVNALLPLLQQKEKVVCQVAAAAFADSWKYLPDPLTVINALLPLLKSKDKVLCQAVVVAFAQSWAFLPNPLLIIDALLPLLKSKEKPLCQATVAAFENSWAYLPNPLLVINGLLPLLKNKEKEIRQAVAKTLGGCWKHIPNPAKLANALKLLLIDKEKSVCRAAQNALESSWVHPDPVILASVLTPMLWNEKWEELLVPMVASSTLAASLSAKSLIELFTAVLKGYGITKQETTSQAKIENADQAIALNPQNANAYFERGIAKYQLGHYQAAISDFDQTCLFNPSNINLFYYRGLAKFQLNHYRAAIADFNQICHIDPAYAKAFYYRGLANSCLYRLEAAIVDFNQFIIFEPNAFDAFYYRGNAKASLNRHQEAIADYNQSIHLNSKNADAYFARSLAKRTLKQFEDAVTDFEQFKCFAYESNLTIVACHILACIYHVRAQRAKEQNNQQEFQAKLKVAERVFEIALQLQERKPAASVHVEFAHFLYLNHRFEEAFLHLNKAIQLKDSKSELSYAKLEQVVVEPEIKKAISFHNNITIKSCLLAYYLLIKTYLQLNQLPKAKEVIEEFAHAANSENNSLIYFLLGHIYQQIEELPQAIQYYQKAAEIYQPTKDEPEYKLAKDSWVFCEQQMIINNNQSLAKSDPVFVKFTKTTALPKPKGASRVFLSPYRAATTPSASSSSERAAVSYSSAGLIQQHSALFAQTEVQHSPLLTDSFTREQSNNQQQASVTLLVAALNQGNAIARNNHVEIEFYDLATVKDFQQQLLQSGFYNLNTHGYPKKIEPHFADSNNNNVSDRYVITLTAVEFNSIFQDDEAYLRLSKAQQNAAKTRLDNYSR